MTKQFKKAEEGSNKKIFELQMKYEMAREEKQVAAEAFEKRLNTMIREFVKAFKKMGELTNNMKAYMTREIEVLNVLVTAKDKEI